MTRRSSRATMRSTWWPASRDRTDPARAARLPVLDNPYMSSLPVTPHGRETLKVLVTADPELPVPPTLYGGIERIVYGLVAALADHGFDVGLVAHRDSRATRGVERFSWPGLRSQHRWDVVRNTATLRQAARAFRPDVL